MQMKELHLLGYLPMHVQVLTPQILDCASGSYNASAGTVVISGSGNNTTIEVNLTDTSGASITALILEGSHQLLTSVVNYKITPTL